MKQAFGFVMTLLAILLFACHHLKTEKELPPSLKLWYDKPATSWNEALPIGNGRLGAMVFGKTSTERIQLNEESLWAGSQINNNNPNALANLGKIRELILNGNIKEATELAEKSLLGTPPRIRSYQTLGDLYLDFGSRDANNYKRELDLNTGICNTSYTSEGVDYTQEVLVSSPDNLIAVRLTSSQKGGLSFDVRLEREKDITVNAVGKDQLILDGQIIDQDEPLRGPGGANMRFGALIKARSKGGEINANGNTLSIKNADEILLLITAATDYKLEDLNYDRSIHPLKICDDILSEVKGKTYEQIKKTHLDEYQSMFNRVSLDIEGHELDSVPTDERLARVKQGADDPGLMTLYFQYGRYLLMGSSRFPGVLPANLQGIWCKDINAPWNSDFHTNINIQMNYWPAEVCNLSETALPLINLMEQIQKPGSVTAREMYGTSGWTMHHLTNAFGRTGLMDGTRWGTFPMAGPWMTLPVYRHFEFTRDMNYLREIAYPIMKGSAQFVLGFLIEDNLGRLVTAPSNSPENSYYLPGSEENFRITYGSTIDIEIITELFKNCIEAADILATDKVFADKLKNTLEKLPKVKISKTTGGIQEWIHDYKEVEPGHRHISHLFGLHPGKQINPSTTELFEGAKNTISRRLENGGGHTGWSRAWIINFYARLKDGENAYFHLNELLRKSTLPNLFDNHAPFQIDGNFGGTAGIAEMLLQSHLQDEEGNYIQDILPALPSKLSKGKISGIKGRGAFELSMEWQKGALVSLEVKSLLGNKLNLRYNGYLISRKTKKGESLSFTANDFK